MNTMLNNIQRSMSLLSQFQQFKTNLQRSGQSPQALLNQLMASGKFSQADINKAKQLAELFTKQNNIK